MNRALVSCGTTSKGIIFVWLKSLNFGVGEDRKKGPKLLKKKEPKFSPMLWKL